MDCPRAFACFMSASYTEVRTVITDSPGLGMFQFHLNNQNGAANAAPNAMMKPILNHGESHQSDCGFGGTMSVSTFRGGGLTKVNVPSGAHLGTQNNTTVGAFACLDSKCSHSFGSI